MRGTEVSKSPLYRAAFAARGTIKKPEAARLIEALFEDYPHEDLRLGNLLAYFQPPAPRKPATAFRWVARAVAGDKEVRHYLRYVYADGERITASNGCYLLRAPDTRAPGYYDPLSGELLHALDDPATPGKYPDVASILPKSPILLPTAGVGAAEVVGSPRAKLQPAVYGGRRLPLDQLEWVLTRCDQVAFGGAARDAVYFRGPDGCEALISPMRG